MFQAHIVALLLLLTCLATVQTAAASENQWVLGGGAGPLIIRGQARGVDERGPNLALNLHGAYELSDWFDLRIEGTSSGWLAPNETLRVQSLSSGVGVKFDVLEWVPYGAMLLGYTHLRSAAQPAATDGDATEPMHSERDSHAFHSGLALGLERRWSRQFGIGVQLGYTQVSLNPNYNPALFLTLLRADYRWGW